MDIDVSVRTIEATRTSLLYLVGQMFHPGVICLEPAESCQRLEDMIRFLSRNLGEEEKLMAAIAYPNRGAHERDHARLLRRLKTFAETHACSAYDNGQVSKAAVDWSARHSAAFDRPLIAHLRKYESRTGRSRSP